MIDEIRDLRRLIHTVGLGLRSLQARNKAPGLVEAMADEIGRWLDAHPAEDGLLLPALDGAPVDAVPGPALVPHAFVLPAAMTPAIRDALGTMNFQTGTLAHYIRQFQGVAIERRCEDEQAVILYWFLSLAARHGDGWRDAVSEHMRAIGRRAEERPTEVSEGRS